MGVLDFTYAFDDNGRNVWDGFVTEGIERLRRCLGFLSTVRVPFSNRLNQLK